MDPNVTLETIRKLIDEVAVTPADAGALAVAQELAEAIDDLDHWLSAGGFLPKSWIINAR